MGQSVVPYVLNQLTALQSSFKTFVLGIRATWSCNSIVHPSNALIMEGHIMQGRLHHLGLHMSQSWHDGP